MRKENTLYVYGEPGAVGFPAQSGERNNPAFSTVVDIASAAPSDEMTIHFAAEPSGAEHGGDQFYLFSLRNLKTPMQKGVTYEDAKGQTIENVTNPIQEIFGGCSSKTQTGRFRFHELELKPNLRPARF